MVELDDVTEIHAQGLAIPHDVAVIGFDGLDLTGHTSPPLSTVAQPVAVVPRVESQDPDLAAVPPP